MLYVFKASQHYDHRSPINSETTIRRMLMASLVDLRLDTFLKHVVVRIYLLHTINVNKKMFDFCVRYQSVRHGAFIGIRYHRFIFLFSNDLACSLDRLARAIETQTSFEDTTSIFVTCPFQLTKETAISAGFESTFRFRRSLLQFRIFSRKNASACTQHPIGLFSNSLYLECVDKSSDWLIAVESV